MRRKVLEFKDWNNYREEVLINEGSTYDGIVNWISKKLVGKVSKIDAILDEIRKRENEYVDEWEDIISDIDSLEIEKSQTKSDPAERKKIERIISRKQKVLDALTKKHSVEIKKLKSEGYDKAKGNERLGSYWEVELSNLESDLAEDMYRKAKDLSDTTHSDELYRKYRSSLEKAKTKDSEFRNKYGSLISFKMDKGGKSDSSMDNLTSMSHESFESRVKTMDPKDIKNLIKYARKKRNDKYAMLDKEKEILQNKIKSHPEEKKGIEEEIKNLSKEGMEKIRDLRTKITIANRYV